MSGNPTPNNNNSNTNKLPARSNSTRMPSAFTNNIIDAQPATSSTTASQIADELITASSNSGSNSLNTFFASMTKKSTNDALNRLKKRPLTSSLGSADIDSELTCPICIELMSAAHITKCGHSFCHSCILRAIDSCHKCPKCNTILSKSSEDVIPNFTLNHLIERFKEESQTKKLKTSQVGKSRIFELINGAQDDLDIDDVNQILKVLAQRKEDLSNTNSRVVDTLTYDFLKHLKQIKSDELTRLQHELQVITEDCKFIETNLNTPQEQCVSTANETDREVQLPNRIKAVVNEKRRVINRYFDELSEVYAKYHNKDFKDYGSMRTPQVVTNDQSAAAIKTEAVTPTGSHQHDVQSIIGSGDQLARSSPCSPSVMPHIRDVITKITDYKQLKTLTTINYSNESMQLSSIVSSMDFDRSYDYFACVGVTKKIKIYDFNAIVDHGRQSGSGENYPVYEMQHSAKLSCVSWNKYFKNQLACSDYDGAVTLWDSEAGTLLKTYQEHEKRSWGVEFCTVDPRIFASASDDTKVKLWSTQNDYSLTTIDARSNVCCVTFQPDSKFHLIFGTADHCIHYYDLRNTKEPLRLFKGHRKAVSYVKFAGENEFISASTDSSLKLWNMTTGQCLTSYTGHVNEKNFVGLATSDEGFIATGSENNTVYLYCNELSKPLLNYKFEDSLFNERTRRDDSSNDFVSALCWSDRDILLSANSQGLVKVIELVK